MLDVRCASFRFIFGCLVMVAVGLSHLLGVSRGFWCECTPVPRMVSAVACVASECHPHHDHDGGGGEDGGPGVSPDDHHHAPPCDHGHEHREVREFLRTTAVAAAITLPAPVVHDLPASMLLMMQRSEMRFTVVRPGSRSGWPSDGSPPMPVWVARTMVMVV